MTTELEPIIAKLGPAGDHASCRRTCRRCATDRQKVKQILVNLLSNALKFTPKGSITIKTPSSPGRRAVPIAVIDTGIGIPKGDQVKIFEDFRQVDRRPARAYGGTGLGLVDLPAAGDDAARHVEGGEQAGQGLRSR